MSKVPLYQAGTCPATRPSAQTRGYHMVDSDLSSKVILHHAIDFRALCGAHLAT